MKRIEEYGSHKRGANRKELALKKRKRDSNFSQSRDIWEDRAIRQIKTSTPQPRHRTFGISLAAF